MVVQNYTKENLKVSGPDQFCLASLLCSKYFVWNCLYKKYFTYNLSQFPSNFNILTYLVTLMPFETCNTNIKQPNYLKDANLIGEYVSAISHVQL